PDGNWNAVHPNGERTEDLELEATRRHRVRKVSSLFGASTSGPDRLGTTLGHACRTLGACLRDERNQLSAQSSRCSWLFPRNPYGSSTPGGLRVGTCDGSARTGPATSTRAPRSPPSRRRGSSLASAVGSPPVPPRSGSVSAEQAPARTAWSKSGRRPTVQRTSWPPIRPGTSSSPLL